MITSGDLYRSKPKVVIIKNMHIISSFKNPSDMNKYNISRNTIIIECKTQENNIVR